MRADSTSREDPPGCGSGVAIDRVIDALAASQHGIVTRAQLLAAGVTRSAITRRVRADRLRPVHPGVYRAGPVRGRRADEVAASLACGPGAAVAHASAATMWGQLPGAPSASTVEVVVPDHGRRAPPDVVVHRSRNLLPDEVTTLDGVPLTTPARTLLDLGSTRSGRELEQAVAESYVLGLTTEAALRTMVARHPRHRGAAALRAILEAGEPAHTRSEAEEVALELIDGTGIERPKANVVVRGYRVDFWWPRLRLVMETDGYQVHSTKRAFERDRQRDAELRAADIDYVRFTWSQLTKRRKWVLVQLGGAIALAEQRARGR